MVNNRTRSHRSSSIKKKQGLKVVDIIERIYSLRPSIVIK